MFIFFLSLFLSCLYYLSFFLLFFFFFNDTATTEIYTLSLHDALPISTPSGACGPTPTCAGICGTRSEEHTSELQSHLNLVCRLLLEKKKKKKTKKIRKKKKKKTNRIRKLKNNK